ncbi:nucleotidyl transferase AbiEii/AbiGii toxin family protein [Bordetella genomosp. 13]|uniref:Nucleotidyl transferase AbiEii/AbiGii toxin family protein n=1 Tax=Bordetella genomosp. 13 TaxID=463040 RepID=A0A1W6ZDK7_9BORD|nr:nucleotidyl transferase AbiEii/AbiGii toxin family protein [Bordetella genomosp. 13]ARP95397.1 hypothetical protein CAL15_13970 [Bordetella genomosp. 13]
MLALNHRISDDIDLFVDSPGWLPFVSPRLNDRFDDEIRGYNEDNIHVKLRFAEGEIDFVVSAPLLVDADLWNPPAAETLLPLEPPAEVLAKKLFLRGWALTARDLFDWVMLQNEGPVEAVPEQELAVLLAAKLDGIDEALDHLGKRPTQSHAWANIRSPFQPEFDWAIRWARDKVAAWKTIAQAPHSSIHRLRQASKPRPPR